MRRMVEASVMCAVNEEVRPPSPEAKVMLSADRSERRAGPMPSN